MKHRLWLDDVRPKPDDGFGYKWSWYTTAEALIEDLKRYFNWGYYHTIDIEYISLDNDLGENCLEGYKVLDWLEGLMVPIDFGIHIHTSNPVAQERMRAIIERNGWREIK